MAIAGGCGTAPCPATVDTTVDGQASHTWGHGYIVPGLGGATSFVVTAGARLPASDTIASTMPTLTFVLRAPSPRPAHTSSATRST